MHIYIYICIYIYIYMDHVFIQLEPSANIVVI